MRACPPLDPACLSASATAASFLIINSQRIKIHLGAAASALLHPRILHPRRQQPPQPVACLAPVIAYGAIERRLPGRELQPHLLQDLRNLGQAKPRSSISAASILSVYWSSRVVL